MSSTLLKDAEHSYEHLALYTAADGVLADAYKVEFQIFDCSTGLPGTLNYPAAGRADVTTGSGHLGTGRYGAYDATTSKPWKPSVTMTRARCVWYYKMTASDSEHIVERWFEVVATTVASQPSSGLVLIQDVKDTGVVLGTVTDRKIHDLLLLWRDTVERYCRQPFRPSYGTKLLRGGGGRALMLPHAFVGIESMTREGYTDVEDLDYYHVIGNEDDERRNPHIGIAVESGDLFTRRSSGQQFTAGVRFSLLGAWGFVEADTLSAPRLVQDATMRAMTLAITDIVAGSSSSGTVAGPISAETTDGHTIRYSDSSLSLSGSRSGFLELLRDAAIRDALDLYRAPLAMGTPDITMVA